jgi:hypothetical protein
MGARVLRSDRSKPGLFDNYYQATKAKVNLVETDVPIGLSFVAARIAAETVRLSPLRIVDRIKPRTQTDRPRITRIHANGPRASPRRSENQTLRARRPRSQD